MSSNESVSAKELLEALRRFEAKIPEYTHLTQKDIIVLRRAATLSPEWVQETVNAIGMSPTVQRALDTTPAALIKENYDIVGWQEVEQQLRGMLQGVSAANLIRRHRLGLTALQAYGIIKQLVRQAEHRPDLLTVYEKLKKMNKLGKRKKNEEEPAAVTE